MEATPDGFSENLVVKSPYGGRQSGDVTTVAASTAVADEGALDGPARAPARDVTASNSALTLKPDKAFVDDPDTTYPEVLDPQTTSASLSGWTTVWTSSPSTSGGAGCRQWSGRAGLGSY